MAAGAGHIFHKKFPQFPAKKRSLLIVKRSEIPVTVDILQNTHR